MISSLRHWISITGKPLPSGNPAAARSRLASATSWPTPACAVYPPVSGGVRALAGVRLPCRTLAASAARSMARARARRTAGWSSGGLVVLKRRKFAWSVGSIRKAAGSFLRQAAILVTGRLKVTCSWPARKSRSSTSGLSIGKKITCAKVVSAASRWCGFFARTMRAFGFHSVSWNAPLLTSSPGLVQATPRLSMAPSGPRTRGLTGNQAGSETRAGRYGVGRSSVRTSVRASGARQPTPVKSVSFLALKASAFFRAKRYQAFSAAISGFRARRQDWIKSSAFSASPFDHFKPSRKRKVHVRPSAETRHDAAAAGSGWVVFSSSRVRPSKRVLTMIWSLRMEA